MTPSGDSKRPKSPPGPGKRPGSAGTKAARRSTERRTRSEQPTGGSPIGGEPGVFSSLPSTRPQRPSARRAAAKRAAAEGVKQAKPAGAKRSARTPPKPPLPPPPVEPPVPRQGFESEVDIEPGAPVQPPSRPELAASVAELLGELAQSGLTTGGRLLKDALGRLPGG